MPRTYNTVKSSNFSFTVKKSTNFSKTKISNHFSVQIRVKSGKVLKLIVIFYPKYLFAMIIQAVIHN